MHNSTDLLTLSSDESDEEQKETQQKRERNFVKRMAIIDSCNVMHGCAGMSYNAQPDIDCQDRPNPDALGLYMMINQLLQESFDVRAFVPASYISGNRQVNNRFALELLQKLGYVTIIDDGSHDDLLILEMAKCVGGFVISNGLNFCAKFNIIHTGSDKFRDHIVEVHSLRELIQTRVVRFKFRQIPVDDIQGGKAALALTSNKYFNGMEFVLMPPKFASMFVVEDSDPSFGMVYCQRMLRSHKRTMEALTYLEVMADYCQQELCEIYGVKQPKLDYFDPEKNKLPPNLEKFLYWWRQHKYNKKE